MKLTENTTCKLCLMSHLLKSLPIRRTGLATEHADPVATVLIHPVITGHIRRAETTIDHAVFAARLPGSSVAVLNIRLHRVFVDILVNIIKDIRAARVGIRAMLNSATQHANTSATILIHPIIADHIRRAKTAIDHAIIAAGLPDSRIVVRVSIERISIGDFLNVIRINRITGAYILPNIPAVSRVI